MNDELRTVNYLFSGKQFYMLFKKKKVTEKFMINIAEPCSEDWNKMTVVDREHKHCSSCEKLVVDFTSMSNDEIVLFLHHNKERTCGRFTSTQLQQAYKPLSKTKHASKWWKAAVLLPLSFFSKNVSAQTDSVIHNDSTVAQNDSLSFQNDSVVATQDSLSEPIVLDSAVTRVDTIYMGDSTIATEISKPKCETVELVTITGSMVYGGFTSESIIVSGGMTIVPSPPMAGDVWSALHKKRKGEQPSITETQPSMVADLEDDKPKDDPALLPIPNSPWYEAILPPSLRPRRNG